MSYNNRRGTPAAGKVGNIGSRRPAVSSNFVSGGQLTPQKGGIQQQQQQQGFNTQSQANRLQQTQQQRQPQVTPPTQQKPAPTPQPAKEEKVPMEQNGSEVKTEVEKKKWIHRKISRKEKIRRRNMRLSKLLQPKNALMILNELVKNPVFNVVDYLSTEGVTHYKAIVTVEGIEHVGSAKSKTGAKNAASETALKYLIKHKKMSQLSTTTSEDGTEQMDTTSDGDAEDDAEGPLPWQQVASFALFKLFSSWGENPSVVKEEPVVRELKPAKKLPDNAASLNPLMVVNQMYPYAQFEDLPQIGNPPNCIFQMKCTVDGQTFNGTGNSKKIAKKNAAFGVCSTLLGVQYPSDVYTPGQ